MKHQLQADNLDLLFAALRDSGYEVIGPRLRDQAIVYGALQSAADLPRGWTDEQEKGRYRLKRRDDDAYFGYAVGPESWKRYLFAPRERLWRVEKPKKGPSRFIAERPEIRKRAFLGVRACELVAIEVQDRVFLKGAIVDQPYRARRESALLIAVQCMTSAATCFCASMDTGPRLKPGFDLSLVELLDHDGHRFLIDAGSPRGEEVLKRLAKTGALTGTSAEDTARADEQAENAARMQTRTLDAKSVPELLRRTFDSPRWDEVATRCLNCANCTLVCPTCFCSTTEDTTDLKGDNAERWRRWDSCFTLDHSYLHGGSVRTSAKSRYRQWLTHKVSSWVDQFDTSGCVGCGRCIAWCPVGIDLTEELEAIARYETNR